MALQNLVAIWSAMDMRRRIIVIGATLAMFLAVLGLARLSSTPGMALLYAGLDAKAAGEVIAALEQQGVAYVVKGDAIHVPSGQRDSLRMALAAEGLPANGGAGYELLDQLSGFSTTSQMFDAAYWRAKEGELARTILANPQIRSARVHIAQAPAQPFQKDRQPSASVTVTTSSRLTGAQAQAIRHLVSAAVVSLMPDRVEVIDAVFGLMPQDGKTGLQGSGAESRAAEIKANVERLLSARVGAGKAVVEVAVDLVTESEQITERRFDPQGRVAISSETEERSGSNQAAGGAVTVASNLPEGDTGGSAGAKTQNTETKERVNYEVSETQREVVRAPGSVRRLSVAVLVDGQIVTGADGVPVWQPRAEDELVVLRDLVASAVGLDEARGDVLTLRSLEFQAIAVDGTLAEPAFLPVLGPIDTMSALQIGVLAFVALVLGLFVLRPILTSGPSRLALPAPPRTLALAANGGIPALTGEIADDDAAPDTGLPRTRRLGDAPGEDPVSRLRRLIEARQTESVEVLRGWMEREEEVR
ncbi:MAG: flagellar basal-body MS-ring/collar protein FliF [Pseudomonadota bacterium]